MMSKRPIFIAGALIAATASAASAQLLGNPLGGLTQPVSGSVGQVGASIGGATGGLGSRSGSPGNAIGGIVGQGQGAVGGVLNQTGEAIGGTDGGLAQLYGFRPSRGHAIAPISLDEIVRPKEFLELSEEQMAQYRLLRLQALIKANKKTLDSDDYGQPVRKGQLIATDPDAVALAAAQRAGFRIIADEREPGLGIRLVTLATPKGVNARKGLRMLRVIAPRMACDYDHIYEPAGGALAPVMGAALAAPSLSVRPGTRIAMIDGGIAAHPSLGRASIEQRGFAGDPEPTGHGTAVGSLLVGDQGPFRGAARGAQLFVADVYGGNPAAGSATVIVRALSWAASKRPGVINISLIGPHNQALARAVTVLRARGIQLVAAVGNDGPAAPPQYPASYPGVIAVTGVDAADRALREAGRSTHLDFAAPGADLVAALPGKGFAAVRGTSFAAPFVAARLAATGSPATLAAEAIPGKGKVGRGIVCKSCRVMPKLVGLK